MKQIIITANDKSLSNYISQHYPLLTDGRLNKFLRQNKIKLNGKKVPLKTAVYKGDVVNFYIDDDYFEIPTAENAYKFSGRMPEIIYEDNNLLVVNKPAGIAVYDENAENYDTLINRVKKYYAENGQNHVAPALCHRLDTGTCGVVMISKNDDFLSFMTELFKSKSLEKTYTCVVKGKPDTKSIIYTAYLAKDSRKGYVTVRDKVVNHAYKPIETHITLLDSYYDYSLLQVGLITGRTHQIRAHLSYLGMPILGDGKYGINSLNRQLKLKYQLLCSTKIKFGKIDNPDYSYLSDKEFSCSPPWFVSAFKERKL